MVGVDGRQYGFARRLLALNLSTSMVCPYRVIRAGC